MRTIKELDKMRSHPSIIFLQTGVNACIAAGTVLHANVVNCPSWDSSGVYMYDVSSLEIIGAISFEKIEWNHTVRVGWAYVHPDHRRTGIHSELIAEIEKIAKRDNYARISRTVAPSNAGMIAAIKSQGYAEDYLSFEKQVIPDIAMILSPKAPVKVA